MGWFSNPKCPIHGIEYKIGTSMFEYYYYCDKCRDRLIAEKKEKQSRNDEIESLKRRLKNLKVGVSNGKNQN